MTTEYKAKYLLSLSSQVNSVQKNRNEKKYREQKYEVSFCH